MEDTDELLTIIKMKKKLCTKYRKICKYKRYKLEKEKEENKSTKLTMATKFKGRCRKCSNWGHKST